MCICHIRVKVEDKVKVRPTVKVRVNPLTHSLLEADTVQSPQLRAPLTQVRLVVCVCACARVCVCVCVCERERECVSFVSLCVSHMTDR